MYNLKKQTSGSEEYSKEITDKVSRICEYYERHNDFQFQRKIIMFMIEVIEYCIPEKYFVTSKKHIHFYIQEALQIWKNGGSEEELNKIKLEYINSISREKPLEKVLENKKENAVMNCMAGVLHNGHDDLTNQFRYDFLELFINELEILNIGREQYINELLDKHFSDLLFSASTKKDDF